MNGSLQPALEALALGMSTVFCGLLLLLLSMKTMATVLRFQQVALERKREKGAALVPGEVEEHIENEGGLSGETLIAIGTALHLDDLEIEEMEARNLTWTRMFKPFSPWVMDSKTTLHTHRLRWRPAGRSGQVVRGQG